MLAIRLPKQIQEHLEKLAEKTGRTKTYYARQAIVQYLDGLEDYYLAVERLQKNLPSIPLDEVERGLGLQDGV